MDELDAVLESLDGLDEQYHGLYKKGASGYHLSIGGIDKHPSVAGIMSTLAKERNEKSKLKGRAESWDRLIELHGEEDATPDGIVEMIQSASGRDDDKDIQTKLSEAEKRGAEKAEARMRKELEKRDEKLQTYEGALRTNTIDAELERAISEAGVRPGAREVVKAYLEKKGPEMVEQDGKFHGMFRTDPDGIPRDVTIAEYVKGWSQTDAAGEFIEAPGGGSGSSKVKDGGGPAPKGTVQSQDGVVVADPAAIVKGDLRVVSG